MTARDAGIDARARIASKLVFTAYMVGAQTMPNEIAEAMASMLAAYPTDWVLGALDRCCRELKTSRLTILDITSRFNDGRPGPEQAWAMVSVAFGDESTSLVWTEGEMNVAWGDSRKLENEVQARMAFLERYKELTAEARDAGRPPTWIVSLGHSLEGREAALAEAAGLNRISSEHAVKLLGHLEAEQLHHMLPKASNLPALPAPEDMADISETLAALKFTLSSPSKEPADLARRIIERADAGEDIPRASLDYARLVLSEGEAGET